MVTGSTLIASKRSVNLFFFLKMIIFTPWKGLPTSSPFCFAGKRMNVLSLIVTFQYNAKAACITPCLGALSRASLPIRAE